MKANRAGERFICLLAIADHSRNGLRITKHSFDEGKEIARREGFAATLQVSIALLLEAMVLHAWLG